MKFVIKGFALLLVYSFVRLIYRNFGLDSAAGISLLLFFIAFIVFSRNKDRINQFLLEFKFRNVKKHLIEHFSESLSDLSKSEKSDGVIARKLSEDALRIISRYQNVPDYLLHEWMDSTINQYAILRRTKLSSNPYLREIERGRLMKIYGLYLHSIGEANLYGQEIQVDYESAFHWFQLAKSIGVAESVYAIGEMYLNGLGCEPDNTGAGRCFLEASRKGVPLAMFRVATMYEHGIGTHTNKAKAIKWYKDFISAANKAQSNAYDDEVKSADDALSRLNKISLEHL